MKKKKFHIAAILTLVLLLACATPGLLAGLEAIPTEPQETQPAPTEPAAPEDPADPEDPDDPEGNEGSKGRPGALGMVGEDFGAMISEMAHTAPGAVAAFMHEQNALRKAEKNQGEETGTTANGNSQKTKVKKEKKAKTETEPDVQEPVGDDVPDGGDVPE